jgi:acyl-[acyl-carrier-protein]-phospholipid O-acyltransferase/long-chain-fatty-acid--[acyl-carrier-protein] ligase
VGLPIPNVAARIRDRESSALLSANQSGLLQIKGPNVMQGYLHDPAKTAEVMEDGWYNTGDVAFIDEDGFIHITGRESRFSKIGGEMVPHILIEESLMEILGTPEEAGPQLVVTAVPDEKKGERLIVVHLPMAKTPQELCDALAERNLPNLFIPSVDSFLEVAELPTVGAGKIDLKMARDIALERAMAARQT